ncbi:MAG: substrate-binding domain-containing protein [Planctomycetota bacterium]|jgi:DNA-binding LacI/PurR family transcriptional regulator
MHGINQSLLPGQLLQLIPVTKENVPSIKKHPEAIDWASLEKIPAGANVFVTSAWYGEIISYLQKRGVKGVFLSNQYEEDHLEAAETVNKSLWPVITVDRFGAVKKVMEYLKNLRKQKTVILKRCENQPNHPFRRGFESYISANPELEKNFSLKEYANSIRNYSETEKLLLEIYEKYNFDSLVFCSPDITFAAVSVLQNKLNKTIPEDVAVISYRDNPEFLSQNPTITAFDFPWSDTGSEAVRIFNSEYNAASAVRFNASIIERGSTISNLDGSAVKTFMPELAESYAMTEEII